MLAQANRKTLASLERETLVKDEATDNEELALAALYEARFAQAQAKRQSGEVGQRLESLDALAKAAARIPRLKYGEAERRQLRNEALACLPLVDLELDREWPLKWHPRLRTAADAMKEHYAVVDQQQTIVVRRMSDNRITARLQGGKGPHRFIEFCPDGKLLAAVRSLGRIDATLLVWRLSDEKTVHESKVSTWHTQAIDFHPSGQSLAVARDGGAIEIINTVSFEVDRAIPGRHTASIVSFSFDGSHLAVARGGLIEIIDSKTGDVTRSMRHSASIFNLAWSADGNRLAAASLNQPVQLWNTAEPAGRLKPGVSDAVPNVAELAQAFPDSESEAPDAVFGQQIAAQITRVGFHPGGKLLWTTGYDGKARLWDLTTGKQVLIGTDFGDFSRDGKWASKVGNTIGRYRVVVPLEHQVLEQPLVAGSATNRAECISVHPKGRILAASKGQLVLWDLATNQPVAKVPAMGTFAKFDPTGEFLVVVGREGLSRRPVKYEETDERVVLTIGSPEQLVPNSEWRGYLAISDDGKSIASADRYQRHRVQIFDVERGTSAVLTPRHDNAKWLDMTSDGRRMVTGTWHGRDVKLWDVESRSVVKTISATKARVRFSPDGKLLVVDEGYRYSIWNTDTWEPIRHHVPRPQGTVPNPIAFSADSRILAVLAERDVIMLLDTSSFEEIAKLPGVVAIDQLLFSPDSSQLIATTASNMNVANKHFVHVWDLDRVRGRLRAMDLDWDHSPLAAPNPGEPKPIVVNLD
jgi:WD40 repeat protein